MRGSSEDAEYQLYQSTESPISALDGEQTWKDCFQRNVFLPNIVDRLHRRAQSFFGTNVIAIVLPTLSGVMKGQQFERKHKRRSKNYLKPIRHVPYKYLQPSWGCITQTSGIFTQEVKDVCLSPSDGTRTVRKRKGNLCCFCAAMRKEVVGESQLLAAHRFRAGAFSRCMVR